MAIEINKDNSISISFGEGIGQSVLSPFSDMMGVNIDDNPGSISSNFKFTPVIETYAQRTVTFPGTDYVNIVAGGSTYRGTYLGRAIIFSSTGTLPGGITAGVVYYIGSNGSPTDSHFKIATNLKDAITGNGYVSITGAGTGIHTISFVVPQNITGYTKNSQGKIFALDSLQRVWFNASDGVNDPWYLINGNTNQGLGDGNGIIYYKGYILVFGGGSVDALLDIQSSTDTVTWTLNFCSSITISNSMANGGKGAVPFLSVNDDAIYFANGINNAFAKIGMLEEVTGQTFNPATPATFSVVADVVTLPLENGKGFSTSIKEINQYLVIGTYSDKVFFWDKKSPSFTSFLQIPESGISSIETVGDLAYIFIEDSGSIYVCNTSSFNLLLKLPDYITNKYYNFVYGLDTLKINYSTVYKRELLFSITIATSTTAKNYLMSYNIDTKKLIKKNISSFGETSDRSGTYYGKIGYIIPFGKNIFISSSNYLISTDKTYYAIESLHYVSSTESGTSSYFVYDNYEPYVITSLFTYGDIYNKKTIKELFISLLRPLETGQGIKIYYRRDDISSWTLLKTIDYATYGAIKELKDTAPITDIIDLQIKIELDGYNLTSPRLKTIRLIP